ncbi:MAG: hypothetical protein LBS70_09710 [Candidatus Accumulibacter sp.]|jgi:uncharacterized protein|nr:hypothetical protein [Accumulibacter sp.]
MGFFKLLLLIVLVLAVLWFFRQPKNRPAKSRPAEKPSAGREPERMVECARCGLYLPESESVPDGAAHYCCAEHRELARGGN